MFFSFLMVLFDFGCSKVPFGQIWLKKIRKHIRYEHFKIPLGLPP